MSETTLFWSPKGGSGTSTVAVAYALEIGVDIADCAKQNDLAAILGLATDPADDAVTPIEAAGLVDLYGPKAPWNGTTNLVMDAGVMPHPVVVQGADTAIVVIRGDYLALRRLMKDGNAIESLKLSKGIVLLVEPSRALGASEVADVAGKPVLAKIPVTGNIARAIDAGVFANRRPDELRRPIQQLARTLGQLVG